MEIILEIIHNHAILFDLINIVALVLSLLLLFPKKKMWHNYIICLYGGFLFGMIPLFVFVENFLFACFGCIMLSMLFIYLHNKLKTRIYIPLLIVIFKILLVLGITLFAEQYSLSMLEFYFVMMFVSVFTFCIINLLHELSAGQQCGLINLFALLEISGVIIQLYRDEYISFEKDLYSITGSASLFLYLLRIDFWIFDYQYIYICCFIFLLFIYTVCVYVIKFYSKSKKRKQD